MRIECTICGDMLTITGEDALECNECGINHTKRETNDTQKNAEKAGSQRHRSLAEKTRK